MRPLTEGAGTLTTEVFARGGSAARLSGRRAREPVSVVLAVDVWNLREWG